MGTYTVTTAQNIDALVNRTGTRAAIAWTRSGTTVTVTWTNHNFVTNDVIQVTVSSDTGAVPLGSKTITVTGANTFTFTGVNTGATSGTITFTSADNFNINGGTLTIDQDYGVGSAAELDAALGNIAMSASLGGIIDFDARAVRLIPYNSGTGNVPAFNTTVSQGGASGKLIGVYSALNVAPTQAGTAMPASGFIKLKQVSGGAFAAGALTGIGASATGADTAGWITINATETRTATVNRLNTFRMRGDWFVVGSTSGSSATTYQIPTMGKAVYTPGVWVETGSGTGVYEFYKNVGSLTALLANVGTEAARGKVCWINSSGVLRFQNDGTNSTGGYLPPSGRTIRIPNIICQNVAIATQATVALPNATLASRFDFTTTGGGVIEMSEVSCAWYLSFAQAFSVTLTNLSTFSQISISEIASPLTWSQIGIGQEAANAQTALVMSLCSAGGTISNMIASRATLASSGVYVATFTDSVGFTFTDCSFHGLVLRGNASADGVNVTRCTSFAFTNMKLIGGGLIIVTSSNLTFTNSTYLDRPSNFTTTTNPTFFAEVSAFCANILFDGLDFAGLNGLAPYSGIVNIAAAKCDRIRVRNLGTAATPLQCGGPEVDNLSWTRSSSTITVTSNAHGLTTGDTITLTRTSDTGAAPLGNESITVTGANAFTFTGVNGGAASGTLSYYLAVPANGVTLAAGAAASNVKIQRVYLKGLRGAVVTTDNSSKNVDIESVWQNPPQPFAVNLAVLNGKIKGFGGLYGTTAQTAVYGTHWLDFHNGDPAGDLTALSWSRTTTTATITSTDHHLKTGDIINVITTSDASAVQRGPRTVTVLTKDTFTITATNAGATSGTIDIDQYNGRVQLMMNEETTETSAVYTIDAGNPSFTSAGGLFMPTINDQITFETPHFIKGHSAFAKRDIDMLATITATNFDVTYDIDQGSGFSGTYKNLSYTRAGGSGSNGATTFTVTDATGVSIGDYVSGTNICPNAKVTNVSSNTITVDLANIGAVSGAIRFNHLPSETIADPSVGFKLRIRIKTVATNTQVFNAINAYTTVTESDRAQTYDLDQLTFTVNGLISGSEVRAYVGTNPATATEIGGTESSGTSFAFTHSQGGQAGYIIVHKEDYEAVYVPLTYASADESLLVQQRFDRNYGNP